MQNLHKKAFSLIEISVVIVIIGILIAGISRGIDLYQDMREISDGKKFDAKFTSQSHRRFNNVI